MHVHARARTHTHTHMRVRAHTHIHITHHHTPVCTPRTMPLLHSTSHNSQSWRRASRQCPREGGPAAAGEGGAC